MPIALPFVTRREIAREYRPDGTVSEESAIRSLRGKKSLSDGISIAARARKGQLGGRAHLYSALNREAARAARRHDVKLAVRIAKAARGLESAPEAKRLTSFLVEAVALTSAADLAKVLSDPKLLPDVQALQVKHAEALKSLKLSQPTLLTGHVASFTQIGALLELEGLPTQISIPRVVVEQAGLGAVGAAVAAMWEILPGGRTLMTVEPAVDTATVNADGEPIVDLYGTPWGRVLSDADPEVLRATGMPTITIPAGIPDVE
jgi:hypothetical protein